NTVVFAGGRRIGHNTDCWGFAESFREGLAGVDLDSVVQFGAGGAGAAVGHALLSLGVRELRLCETEMDRARHLASRLSDRFGAVVHPESDVARALSRANGIVNATPVGMEKFPGLPFDETLLRRSQWVADV